MDLSDRIGLILQSTQQVRDLLHQQRIVVCFGQRATLCFAIAGPLSAALVVGACTTAAETLERLARLQPDVLLCGDQLEEGCGLELVIAAKQRWPLLRTLLLVSGQPRPAQLKAVIDVGCDGLLLDSTLGAGTASAAVATVCSGGIVVDRAIVELLRPQLGSSRPAPQQALSAREREVLTLLARGDNNADIARQLVISIETVKSHLKSVLLKLSARGRTHAAVLALQLGLVDWPADPQGR